MRTFVLLALPGLYQSSLHSVLDILRIGDRHVRERVRESHPRGRLPPTWVIRVLSIDEQPMVTASGAKVSTDGNIHELDPSTVDAVFIPALDWTGAARLRQGANLLPMLSPWLAQAHEHGAVIAAHHIGICAVAEAALLNGGDASVPLSIEAWFRQRYPRVHCDHRLPMVQSRGIVSAAALDQGPHLACHLVDHFGSQIVAARTRQEVLQAGHSPQPSLGAVRASDPIIERAQNWFLTHMTERPDVQALAAHLALSQRSLFRRFREALDTTPLQYLQTLRLETARRALERTSLSVEGVAHSVGYEDVAFFASLFQRRFGKTPAAYRRQLRDTAAPGAG